ncbi:MAG TPA: ABC transporter permease [Candidatus Baltobacteraceae bacterium]|nr:ABC transporter permease [Candidatus Baltobacteraceae bacterium]
MTTTPTRIKTSSFNGVALWTLVKREVIRSLKIINQVIWPPIISTLLYVFVFGLALGSRIQSVQGVSYAQFLIPGLIMLQSIDSSYGECSSSVFQGRFMNSIQEMLIAPMSAFEVVAGYVLGSLARTYLIAVLITLLGAVLVHTWPQNWVLYLGVLTLVSVLFSSLGLIFGLIAEKFDHLAVLTTFIITPLTFVGGVFTSAQMLPLVLRRLELFNPIFYTIDAFRRSYTGESYLSPAVSVSAIALLSAVALAIALRMVASGYKLRS